MAFTLTPEEKERWKAHRQATARMSKPSWNITPLARKKKAIALYTQTGSKHHVCSKLHMCKNTLDNILKAAGVV